MASTLGVGGECAGCGSGRTVRPARHRPPPFVPIAFVTTVFFAYGLARGVPIGVAATLSVLPLWFGICVVVCGSKVGARWRKQYQDAIARHGLSDAAAPRTKLGHVLLALVVVFAGIPLALGSIFLATEPWVLVTERLPRAAGTALFLVALPVTWSVEAVAEMHVLLKSRLVTRACVALSKADEVKAQRRDRPA